MVLFRVLSWLLKLNVVALCTVSQTLISNSEVINNATSVSKKKEKKEQLSKAQKRKLIGRTGELSRWI